MSRRKAPTLATLADNAAAGRRVVASSGQLDGPFLAALAKVHFSLRKENLVPIGTIRSPRERGGGADKLEISDAILAAIEHSLKKLSRSSETPECTPFSCLKCLCDTCRLGVLAV